MIDETMLEKNPPELREFSAQELAVQSATQTLSEILGTWEKPENADDSAASPILTDEIRVARVQARLSQLEQIGKVSDDFFQAWEKVIESEIPESVRLIVASLREAQQAGLNVFDTARAEIEAEIKPHVLTLAVTVKAPGVALKAIYAQGRRTVKADSVTRLAGKYAKTAPEVAADVLGLIETGEPSVTIRR